MTKTGFVPRMTNFKARQAAPTSDIVNIMMSGLNPDQADTLCRYLQEAMMAGRNPKPAPAPAQTSEQLGSKKRVMS